ncbi:MAG: hypothetical protein DME71_12370, partial [Verrucomicrobia bacterium]
RRTIFVADAHRDNGKRFVVRADEKLTAFMELEAAIRAAASCLTFNSEYVRLNSHALRHAFRMHWNASLRRSVTLSPSLRQ